MANFLDNLSEYNAKAAVVISQAVADGNSDKANMMSSLKTTANDTTLSEDIRLNSLTALINLGGLLDIALPPYFPITTTYANTQAYVGDHNSLSGLQGGAPGEYYHLTSAQLSAALNAASIGDITFANLGGVYSDNASLNNALLGKQNILSGTGFVTINGTTISYDNSTYLTTISGIAAGGELIGTYPNPGLSNAAVISKQLTGFVGVALPMPITSSDTILSAIQKLNDNISSVIISPSGVSTVALANNATSVFTTTSTPASGAVTLSLELNTQNGNLILASPNGTSGQPSFRSLVTDDLPNTAVAAGSYGSTTVIPVITVDAKGRITNVTNATAASGGQVNSITLSVPSILSPSSIDNTNPAIPQIVLQLDTQTANTVFAGPTTGAAATPTFRTLVEDDIPSLSINKITNLSATLSTFLTDNLSDGKIWVGNVSNGAEMRTLTGDVTLSNTGVTTIGTAKVQYSMIQDVTAQTILGRYELTNGVVQQINLNATDFVLDNITGELSLATPVAPVVTTKGDLLSFNTVQDRLPSSNVDGDLLMVYNTASNGFGLQWNTINGDVTVTDASTGEITIANSAVTLGKMANLAANSVIGNNTGSSATPIALSQAQLTAMINQFTSSLPGVVPASGGGTTNFLRADGSWASISGGGTTTNALTINNSGSGASSGATFDGSSAITISYNTIGSPSTSGTNATGTWSISITGNAATVTNGLYSTGSYSNPTWLTSISGSIVSGNISGNAANVSGIVALANGGTNANLTAVAGAVAWSSSNSINFTASGSTGQILRSAGTSSPTWSTATYPATTTSGKILVSTSNNVIGEIDAPTVNDTFLKWNAGVFSWATAGSGSGDVTGPASSTANAIVVFNGTTGKIIKDSGITFPIDVSNGGTGITSGASGGILFFDSTSTISSTSTLAANSIVVGGGAGIAPSTITTGTGVVTALGVNVGTAGSFVVNGGALGTPVSGNFSSGTFTWPTFNQNTTGSAATLTTARDIQTNLASTSAASFNGSANITPGVTGTLPVGNGGTGIATATAYAVICAGTTSTGAFQNVSGVGTSGQVLTSNGAGALPTWQNAAGGSTSLTTLTASTATASISNANSIITWNWSSNTTQNAFVLNSTSLTSASLFSVTHTTSALTGNLATITSTGVTTGNLLNLGISGTTATSAKNLNITNSGTANTSGRGIDVSITGATASGNTFAAVLSNTKTGATSTNTALQLTSSGGTTNYALDVTAGISRFAAGAASTPQIVLSPSSLNGALTGVTNGSIWYDTTTASSNSSLYLYKDSGLTKFITLDRNIDFAVGSASGVIISDASGNLTKSADLTALGIYAQTNTITAITTGTAVTLLGTLTGSATLSANFFGAGKTIEMFCAGILSTGSSPTIAIAARITDGTTTVTFGTFTYDTQNLTSKTYRLMVSITNRISGSNPTFGVFGEMIVNHTAKDQENVFIDPASVTATSLNTSSALTLQLVVTITGTGNSINSVENYAYYLN